MDLKPYRTLALIGLIVGLIACIPIGALYFTVKENDEQKARFFQFCVKHKIELSKCKLPNKAYTTH